MPIRRRRRHWACLASPPASGRRRQPLTARNASGVVTPSRPCCLRASHPARVASGVVTPPTPLLPGGGGTGGGGTGTGGGGDGTAGGGDGSVVGGGGFGGGPVNEPEVHRQLARILGTDFASRGDVISDAVRAGSACSRPWEVA